MAATNKVTGFYVFMQKPPKKGPGPVISPCDDIYINGHAGKIHRIGWTLRYSRYKFGSYFKLHLQVLLFYIFRPQGETSKRRTECIIISAL
jgi:hypothetical protein